MCDHAGMTDLPTSWAAAQALRAAGWPDGLPKHFFTGKPCKRGHIAPRMASDGNCTECKRMQDRAYDSQPHVRDKANAYAREYTKRPERAVRERYYAAKGRADRQRATPPWLTAKQKQATRTVYEEAQRLTDETGIPHHVDHVIPLKVKELQARLGDRDQLPSTRPPKKGGNVIRLHRNPNTGRLDDIPF